MTSSHLLLPRLAAVLLVGPALLLAGCATAPAGAVDGPAATSGPAQPTAEPAEPAEDPAGDPAGDPVPAGDAGFWLAGVGESAGALRTTLDEWAAQDCTVAAAIDGEYSCTGMLTAAALAAATVDERFASVADQGFTAAELDELAPVGDAAAAAAEAHAAWTDAECNWEASSECTPAAEDVLATATALRDALDEAAL